MPELLMSDLAKSDEENKIVRAFLNGSVKGLEESQALPERMDTMISHLFLFPKTVYKFCKRDNEFFNQNFRDLADKQVRRYFYSADFFENNYFSPEVYIQLFGLFVIGDSVEMRPETESADDFVIKMKRIDLSCNLSNLLHQKTLNEQDFRTMGYQQTKAVVQYPKQPRTSDNYYDIFQRRLRDLENWMLSSKDFISNSEIQEIMVALSGYVEKHRNSFENFDVKKYVVSLDNHSDNIFYDKKIFFLDIYPPKEDWMIVTPWTNIYRPAADILLLMGEKYARAFIQGYKDYYGSLDETHELFYLVYSAAIQGVSLHNLSEKNALKKEDSLVYKKYILDNIGKL